MYLIHGVFFQNYTSLGIAMVPIEGATAVIQTRLAQHWVFHGIIGKDPAHPAGPLVGEVEDHFGVADLSDIRIHGHVLSFTKNYRRRDYGIQYSLRLTQGGSERRYEGEYTGVPGSVGSGFVRCVLVQVPDGYLQPPPEVLRRAREEYENSERLAAQAELDSQGVPKPRISRKKK